MAAPHNDNIKEKILEAATALLAEKSFNEISLSEIAKRSGVAKGSVYYYYKTKDDILCDVADGYLMGMYEELISWVENKEKDTSLPRLLRFVLTRGADDPAGSLRLHLTVDAVDGNEEIKARLKERYRIFREAIGEKIAQRKPDADAQYYGWLVLTVIDGLMVQILLGNEDIDSTRFIEDFIAMVDK
ncbi:MAG: TetR/AcrR family transcriptional regulator [Emergencia sp.]